MIQKRKTADFAFIYLTFNNRLMPFTFKFVPKSNFKPRIHTLKFTFVVVSYFHFKNKKIMYFGSATSQVSVKYNHC